MLQLHAKLPSPILLLAPLLLFLLLIWLLLSLLCSLSLLCGLTWKKDVCEGSMPVPPAGMKTSLGASRPTRAGAPTLYLLISSLIYRDTGGTSRPGKCRYRKQQQQDTRMNIRQDMSVLKAPAAKSCRRADCLSQSTTWAGVRPAKAVCSALRVV